MAIYLLRHGETDANVTRVVQRPEVPLSARGREQAERLARRLAEEGIARVRTSDLARALETARALEAATAAPLDIDPALAERNYGAIRGTAYADLPTDIFAPDYEPPEGETWATFHARVDRAWADVLRVAAATSGNLAVVTHGLVCERVLQRHLDGGSAVGAAGWGNTCVTVIEPPRTLRLLACTAHLDGAAPAGGAV
jgi:broad specificity phosphatase PhoE